MTYHPATGQPPATDEDYAAFWKAVRDLAVKARPSGEPPTVMDEACQAAALAPSRQFLDQVLYHAMSSTNRDRDVATALLAGANANALTPEGDPLIHVAIRNAASVSNAPFGLAKDFYNSKVALVIAFARAGANLELPDAGGYTSLQSAAFNGLDDLIADLLQHGALPDLSKLEQDGVRPSPLAIELVRAAHAEQSMRQAPSPTACVMPPQGL